MPENGSGSPTQARSTETSAAQLDLAWAQGEAYGRALASMTNAVAEDGGDQQAGDYLIGYAVETAEGMRAKGSTAAPGFVPLRRGRDIGFRPIPPREASDARHQSCAPANGVAAAWNPRATRPPSRFARFRDREETAMEREPLHSYEDRPEETHARANRPRAIDARRNILVGATIAAILLIIVVVLVL